MCLLPEYLLNIVRKQNGNADKVKQLTNEVEAAAAGAPIEPLDAGVQRTLARRYRPPMPTVKTRKAQIAGRRASLVVVDDVEPARVRQNTVYTDSFSLPSPIVWSPPSYDNGSSSSSDFSSGGGDFGGGGSDASF